ncbi:MAG: tRNA lysidine(34) synthetase TilS [Anaerolineales bacterium]
MDLAKLANALRQESRVGPDQPLVLGFSGGPDSLALLHALHALGQRLILAHLDHGLRPESGQEAQAAEKTAASYGLPFFEERADVAAQAKADKIGIEEAAREARYRFLFRVAEQQAAPAVAVAHNADDQVETVLMHLLRGAGPAGLRGMAPRLLPNPWSAHIALVRPLLGLWRHEILDYCAANSLQPVMDISNQDLTLYRNRLRHELVPLLEGYAPGFKGRLVQTANVIAADQTLIETLVAQAWPRCLAQRGAGFLHFDRFSLLGEPLALQRGLLRKAFADLRPEQRDLDFAAVERALGLVQSAGNTALVNWLADLYLLVEGDKIWIADWDAELPVVWPQAPENAIHLEVPAELELNEGWWLQARATEQRSRGVRENQDDFQAWLDLDAAGEELILRRRHPGDRFQPLGMERGSVKLSDFFINVKLPRRAREAWPLVCRGDEIVWVPGYRLAHPFRLQDGGRRALHLKLAR